MKTMKKNDLYDIITTSSNLNIPRMYYQHFRHAIPMITAQYDYPS